MVYTANGALFPLHRDFILHQNLFRVPISLSECMPDFAMCYENTKNVFEIARGFLTAVIMDMHAAGRMAFHRGRGVIKHGTLRTATDDAVFFVFDVFASDWAQMLAKLGRCLALIGCFGQAPYTTAKWASTAPQTKLEPHTKLLAIGYWLLTIGCYAVLLSRPRPPTAAAPPQQSPGKAHQRRCIVAARTKCTAASMRITALASTGWAARPIRGGRAAPEGRRPWPRRSRHLPPSFPFPLLRRPWTFASASE
jgi:hypothetical protein